MNLQKLGKWSFIIIGGLLAIAVGLLALSNLMAGRDTFNLLGVNSDIFRMGMALHKEHTALRLLAVDDPIHSGKGIGNILHDVCHPLSMFQLQLLLGKMKRFPAHIRKAQVVALHYEVRSTHKLSRAELLQLQTPEGITQGF